MPNIAFWDDYGIWPKLILTNRLTSNELQGRLTPMPEQEIKVSQDQWNELLAKQIAKQTTKPTRATVPATKHYKEKSFVSVHYTAAAETDDADTVYSKRNPQTYAVLHFYMRPGDGFQTVVNDARNYFQMFPNCKIICHNHAWNEPCSPAPKLLKCKEITG